MSLKAVGYVKVSVEEGVTNGYSLGNQRDGIREFIQARGWELMDIYQDDGYSAIDLNRLGMRRLMQNAMDRRFDVIVVYDQDRLSRERFDSEFLIKRVFKPNDIRFLTVNATIEDDSPEGDFTKHIKQAQAEHERRKISQRVKAGIARSMEADNHYGKIPYGFIRVNGKLMSNPKEQRAIGRIRELGDNGNGHKPVTRSDLVKVLDREGFRSRLSGSFSLALIHRVLTDPMYQTT
jgi:site-specific DNA recombinase